jgi:hypothetical protein
MNTNQQLVPTGVMGELVVTGDGLARGYTDSAQDVNRFVQITTNDQVMRAYRTGDRARYRPRDGQIEFFGRMDQQVKVRGHRIEPTEVEHAILSNGAVCDAVVVIRKQGRQEPELVGFVVASEGTVVSDMEMEMEIRKYLQTLLPSYMVPAQIIMVCQMPINANGKVDRLELSQRAHVTPKNKPSTTRVAPSNQVEAALCEEFADVLGAEVGITDSFFGLGGHSLMAMKLATRISRRLGAQVSVKDIFVQPTPLDLASKIRFNQMRDQAASNESSHTGNCAPFQLLSMADPQEFVRNEIIPQLDESHSRILDVYPSTWVQKTFLHDPRTGNRRRPTPFFIDTPPNSDCGRLVKTVEALIQHFDIFRTVFVFAEGRFYQVVLEHLEVPIETILVEESVSGATRAVEDQDKQIPLILGQSLLRVAFLKQQGSTVRIVLRMSHALYDGLSLEPVLTSFHALYSGNRLPAPPKFARYIQHMADSRKGGHEFWRSVLHGSSMTRVKGTSGPRQQPERDGSWFVERIIEVPIQASLEGITPATVFTTACALMLANETGSNDVVFGRVVSGRQYLPVSDQHIVGPCTNVVPVRICTDRHSCLADLLRSVQDQYLNSLPFETLGFEEIKETCTDWPETTTNYGCATAYQAFEMLSPESQIQDQRVRLEHLSQDTATPDSGECNTVIRRKPQQEASIHDVDIAGMPEPDGSHLRICIAAYQRTYDESTVDRMLNDLCERVRTLNLAYQHPIAGGPKD